MSEKKLGVVEDTLYVPMLGRIYASESCRNILYDKKALELKKQMPEGMIENDTQTQYTYLASAARSGSEKSRRLTEQEGGFFPDGEGGGYQQPDNCHQRHGLHLPGNRIRTL